ncbi:hypothetical protein PC116_g2872 [Phytophthora cactorum]|uniref:Uncharacterized protein n=1 Tax=Phytophthora cactorum TaxID=29920 RepID=A0A8T1LP61_9STRA|nr:hypothetical protein Pcac1_g14835 [Phytophthora cactorum]KAG2892182.1 hypothetical protein PC117_g24056 [Phytophthora cactorum]KAG2912880.1 hypothetical protein PC114_g8765 [Phytophthora cactorum]KAG3033503.1 hypothetical protein PC119_g5313 [Phytophthora cactorum]KAG3149669.1 hypothetical protein C6341_g16969 [Phytophthora cactorum]
MRHILVEVGKIIASVKNSDVPDIDREMREHLRMGLSESDVSERVIQHFNRCHDVIEKHSLSLVPMDGSNYAGY